METTLKATDFIRTASKTAHHFGFRALDDLKDDARCKNCEKSGNPKILVAQKRLDALHGALAGGISAYFEHNLHGLGEPALFYTIDDSKKDAVQVSLQVLGTEKSIAESLLIRTIRSLFHDLNITEHSLRINSVGDRESVNRYSRELGNYFRKRIEHLPPTARELMKEHVLMTLGHLIERGHELGSKSPSALEYLNESSRKHFREIIEYLDQSETPYEIDPRLLGHHQCYSHTIFSFDTWEDESRATPHLVRARGGRYDEFVYQMTKQTIPAVGAVITLEGQAVPLRLPKHPTTEPSVCMVQLGFGPRVRSLSILEDLRHAEIPVHQSIASDSLSGQLETARQKKIPYTVILGQKELVDNTVIVRNMFNSSQENVAITGLVSYLKRATKV